MANIRLEIPIWNKIEVDKVKVEGIPAEGYFFIKVDIDDKEIFSKKFDNTQEFNSAMNDILDRLDKIATEYYTENEEEFHNKSDEFFKHLKTI